ncbi:hypothetical protein KA977_05415 [Candidatus Dependentiae bacterium]|nr:hypothetical protein [Candidatus Dependentiae bacterium]
MQIKYIIFILILILFHNNVLLSKEKIFQRIEPYNINNYTIILNDTDSYEYYLRSLSDSEKIISLYDSYYFSGRSYSNFFYNEISNESKPLILECYIKALNTILPCLTIIDRTKKPVLNPVDDWGERKDDISEYIRKISKNNIFNAYDKYQFDLWYRYNDIIEECAGLYAFPPDNSAELFEILEQKIFNKNVIKDIKETFVMFKNEYEKHKSF